MKRTDNRRESMFPIITEPTEAQNPLDLPCIDIPLRSWFVQQDTGIKSFYSLDQISAILLHKSIVATTWLMKMRRIIHRTACHKTEPWGYHDQPVFYNEIWTLETD